MKQDDVRNPHKKVDESWKDEIAAERSDVHDTPHGHNHDDVPSHTHDEEAGEDAPEGEIEGGQANFQIFLSTLAMQAYIALGELEDPARKVITQNLPQAHYMIDLIGMLQEKTRGNLTPQEQNMINALLYELRMRFLQKTEATPPGSPS